MKTLAIQVTPESLDEVMAFVENELENLECGYKASMKIMVAVDEIYSNLIYYSGAKMAQITIQKTGETLTLIFSDDGCPYNPLAKEDPDTSAPLEARNPGGMGIYIVKKSMDEVSYKHEQGKNILILSKNILG